VSDAPVPDESLEEAAFPSVTSAPDAPETPQDHRVDDDDAEPEAAPPVFRVMGAETVTFDLGDASPMVHLMETENPFRSIAVPIALPEAQALHLALEGRQGRRPGTHELTAQILAHLRADVVAARIVRYEAGIFYAELDLMAPAGRIVLDCRTSDAMILALRQAVPAPILCAEEVLAAVGD
jgi:bifunctional DNase/RNase